MTLSYRLDRKRFAVITIIFSMAAHDTQAFFTPNEFSCQQEQLLSQTSNIAEVLLSCSEFVG